MAVYFSFYWLNDFLTCGFELVTRGFELVTRKVEHIARGFELALLNFNSCF